MLSRSRLGIFAAFVALFALYFSPVLAQGRLLAPNDGLHMGLPYFLSPPELWSPHLLSGFPVFADGQEQRWYLPAQLLALAPGGAAVSWNAFVILGYALASFGAYLYAREVTASEPGALVAGLVHGMSGFFVSRVRHANLIHEAAWLPFVLLALERLRERVTPWRIAALALAVAGLALAGHPQIFVYGLSLAGVYTLVRALDPPAGRRPFLAAALLGTGLGVALAAVTLVPMAELVRESERAAISAAKFSSYALPPRQLPSLIFPYLYGGMGEPYAGATSFSELTGYMGILPLLLAGIAAALAPPRRLIVLWAGVALFTIAASLGLATPLGEALYHVPLYGKFRAPARHMGELALAIGVLASAGIAFLSSTDAEARLRAIRRASVIAPALALLVLGAAVLAGATPRTSASALVRPAVLVPLATIAASLLLLRIWAARPASRPLSAALAAIVLADLGLFGWFCEWRTEAPLPADLEMPAALAPYRAELERTGQRLTPALGLLQPADAAPPNRSRLFRLRSTSGYNPMVLRRYAELTDLNASVAGGILESTLDPRNRSLDILASRYLMWPRELAPDLPTGPRWRRHGELPDTIVLENLQAMPRAWLVPETRLLAHDEILAAIRTSALPDGSRFDPRALALVEDASAVHRRDAALALDAAVAALEGARVEVTDISAQCLEIRASVRAPAFLVVSEVYHEGWRATFDGAPAPLHRTDYVLRGTPLPAGDHVVRLLFRPRSLYVGGAISGLALLVIAGLLFAGRRAAPESLDPPATMCPL